MRHWKLYHRPTAHAQLHTHNIAYYFQLSQTWSIGVDKKQMNNGLVIQRSIVWTIVRIKLQFGQTSWCVVPLSKLEKTMSISCINAASSNRFSNQADGEKCSQVIKTLANVADVLHNGSSSYARGPNSVIQLVVIIWWTASFISSIQSGYVLVNCFHGTFGKVYVLFFLLSIIIYYSLVIYICVINFKQNSGISFPDFIYRSIL